MNIIYFANPNSIHDIKWISYFSAKPENSCYIIPQKHQLESASKEIHHRLGEANIHYVPPLGVFSIPRFFYTLRAFRQLKKIIKDKNIDIIHVLYGEPNALWALGKNYLGVKFFLTTRGTDVLVTIPDHFRNFSIQNLYVRCLYKKAFSYYDRIISTSLKQIDSIKKHFKIKCEPVIIRTGIDIPNADEYSDSLLPDDLKKRNFILMPRKMSAIYNHEFTISAFQFLPLEIKEDYVFVFLDADSEKRDYVQLIQELIAEQTDTEILFLPSQNQNELYTLYAYAKAVIMNPKSDGAPVSAMEAMAFKKPLILGPLEYDEDLFGKGVMRLSSWDEKELANKIRMAVTEEVEGMVNAAYERVLNLGNRSNEMSKLEKLYQEELK
ncbi:glycosyltransferase [Ekhidna sp.]|uniref:glycosyltransferase n=1 Tax=Ekhidna sp. TaxID=2608089 RepID=UPI0032EC16B7